MGKTIDRTGVLIVRAFSDGTAGSRLRIRVTQTLDIESHRETVSTLSTADEACEVLRTWLDAFVLSVG